MNRLLAYLRNADGRAIEYTLVVVAVAGIVAVSIPRDRIKTVLTDMFVEKYSRASDVAPSLVDRRP